MLYLGSLIESHSSVVTPPIFQLGPGLRGVKIISVDVSGLLLKAVSGTDNNFSYSFNLPSPHIYAEGLLRVYALSVLQDTLELRQ